MNENLESLWELFMNSIVPSIGNTLEEWEYKTVRYDDIEYHCLMEQFVAEYLLDL